MKRKRSHGIPPSLQVIADWEQRIVKQKQLIAELKRNNCPTELAEAELGKHLRVLAMLRNHSEIALDLTKADPYKMGLGEERGQRGTSARNRAG